MNCRDKKDEIKKGFSRVKADAIVKMFSLINWELDFRKSTGT